MTPGWYTRYYNGEYRRQMAAYRGQQILFRPEDMFQGQLNHGRWIARYLKQHGIEKLGSILEIGSSTGGLLKALGDEFRAEITGIEPSAEEADFACRHGVRTMTTLFEECNFDSEARFDLIICSQAYNHLLDPRRVTEKVRGLLRPRGVFYLECMDFVGYCKFQGAYYNAVQIDHVSMFVPATLQSMCQVAGLEIIPSSLLCDSSQSAEVVKEQRAAGIPFIHARLLAKAGRPQPPAAAFQAIRQELDALQLHPVRTFLRLKFRRVIRRLSALRQWMSLRQRIKRYVSFISQAR
jgi:SAM-dependent methyltransferase